LARERKWVCSCPDYSKRINKITTLSYSWANLSRDWSTSAAGATGDCKHIMNAKLLSGISVGPFEDAITDRKTTFTLDTKTTNTFAFKRPKGFNK
jgi:hypothetical protein